MLSAIIQSIGYGGLFLIGVDFMYTANEKRYENKEYNFLPDSGLALPKISLGLWQNFGDEADYDEIKDIIYTAFDNGITHFDLANNYGPAPGSAKS